MRGASLWATRTTQAEAVGVEGVEGVEGVGRWGGRDRERRWMRVE